MTKIKQKAFSDIRKHGGEILGSVEFTRAFSQTHHKKNTVASHSLEVAVISLVFARALSKLNIETDTSDIVKGSLAHDLGMLGRAHKYSCNKDCYKSHPEESVSITEGILSGCEFSPKAKDIIRHHMWPVTSVRPTSVEGTIVSLADKCASVKDFFTRPFRKAM